MNLLAVVRSFFYSCIEKATACIHKFVNKCTDTSLTIITISYITYTTIHNHSYVKILRYAFQWFTYFLLLQVASKSLSAVVVFDKSYIWEKNIYQLTNKGQKLLIRVVQGPISICRDTDTANSPSYKSL